MTNNSKPLRINVGFLLNQPVGASRDIPFEIPRLAYPDVELLDLAGEVRLTRTVQGVLVQASFEAAKAEECVRCLAEFMQPLNASFTELFAYKTKAVTDSGLLVPDNGDIDLAPLVREYLLLEVPIKPLCRPDCKGLCVICGADLNMESCEHQQEMSQEE